MCNCLTSRFHKNKTLLSRVDGHGLWLNSLLLDISSPSMYGIFRSSLSGSQMNSLSGATTCYVVECHPAPVAGLSTSRQLFFTAALWLVRSKDPDSGHPVTTFQMQTNQHCPQKQGQGDAPQYKKLLLQTNCSSDCQRDHSLRCNT